uniref:hypothetical protein n=1 Tax=Streptomyces sp. st77 TaxID=1828074 RepID=UPI001C54EAB5
CRAELASRSGGCVRAASSKAGRTSATHSCSVLPTWLSSGAIQGWRRTVARRSAVFAGTEVGAAFSEDYMPVVFSRLEDGTGCVCIGMRCGPKVA